MWRSFRNYRVGYIKNCVFLFALEKVLHVPCWHRLIQCNYSGDAEQNVWLFWISKQPCVPPSRNKHESANVTVNLFWTIMIILKEACLVLRLQMKDMATTCGGSCVISMTKFCIMSPLIYVVWEFIHQAQWLCCCLKHVWNFFCNAIKCFLWCYLIMQYNNKYLSLELQFCPSM